jgi:hypothetical protein
VKKVIFLVLPILSLGLLFSCASTPQGSSSKELAIQARDKALSVKADVAAKQDFDAAQAVLEEAEALDAAKDSASSAKYQEAEGLYSTLYESVKVKYDAASKELDAAKMIKPENRFGNASE